METLRRPAVYQGVTHPHYEMEYYTSDVYSTRFNDRILKAKKLGIGYLGFHFRDKKSEIDIYPKQHGLLAETFPDLLPKSPIVSHYGLEIGNDRHELKTPTGFNFICNLVCPDHIDGNKANNHHSNIMIMTQFENIFRCGPKKGRKYKGIFKTATNSYLVQIRFRSIIDKNGRFIYTVKTFETEEEAALAYNPMLEEILLNAFGPDLGAKMYDIAYKNVIEIPCQAKQR
jgi:hypothetical protein